MKKGYWIVAYKSISDESANKAYGELALPAVQSFGGRFLTRSFSTVQPHEAGLQQRTVVVEFESYEKALAALVLAHEGAKAYVTLSIWFTAGISWQVLGLDFKEARDWRALFEHV